MGILSKIFNTDKLSYILRENEDEFDVEAPENWNVHELKVGDFLDSSNLKMQNPYKKFKIIKTNKDNFGWNVVLDVYNLVEEPILGTYGQKSTKKWVKTKQTYVSISSLEKQLKPGFGIDVYDNGFHQLDESEFDVDSPEGWNVKELTVGDRITPDMLKNPDRYDYDFNHFLYHPEYRVEIKKVDTDQFGEYVVLYITTPEDIVREKRDLDALNSLLKPDYQIVSPTNLVEGEFDVEAPEDWDKEILTIGDKITPDMWNDDVNNLSRIKEFNKVLKKPFIIKNIFRRIEIFDLHPTSNRLIFII